MLDIKVKPYRMFFPIQKEKICRACVRASKNSPNKKEQVVDTEQTDQMHSYCQA